MDPNYLQPPDEEQDADSLRVEVLKALDRDRVVETAISITFDVHHAKIPIYRGSTPGVLQRVKVRGQYRTELEVLVTGLVYWPGIGKSYWQDLGVDLTALFQEHWLKPA